MTKFNVVSGSSDKPAWYQAAEVRGAAGLGSKVVQQKDGSFIVEMPGTQDWMAAATLRSSSFGTKVKEEK